MSQVPIACIDNRHSLVDLIDWSSNSSSTHLIAPGRMVSSAIEEPSSLHSGKRRRLEGKQQGDSSRKQKRRDRFYLAVSLSIIVAFLVCSNSLEEGLVSVNAFVPSNKRTRSLQHQPKQWNGDKIKDRRTHLCLAKKQQQPPEEEEDNKSWSTFFKRKDDDDAASLKSSGYDDPSKSSSIPFVGRFFSTDEEKAEKEEKKRQKKAEKEKLKNEKEKLKLEERSKRKQQQKPEGDKKRNKIIPIVQNYFQGSAENEPVVSESKRKEEERQRQLEQDAEELRLEVQRIEEERKRRKIEAQKEMDQQRKERLERKKAAMNATDSKSETSKKATLVSRKEEGKSRSKDDKKDKEKSGSSKSQRFGSVMDAAQRLVSGVFDSKQTEEWIVVAPKTRISPGEIVPVTAGGIDLLLVASRDGSAVHCVANSCPHLGTPLEVGSLERLPIESSSSTFSPMGDSTDVKPVFKESSFFRENDITRMLKEDGCEDCIVCPLHKTAFALESGEVRGEWCPYPPVIGKLTGAVKQQSNLPVFDVRIKGKNIEVRLNTPVEISEVPE